MSTARNHAAAAEPAAPDRKPGLWAGWVGFWFSAVDPVGLHRVRVLTGVLLVGWLLTLAGHQDAFFGLGGWFDGQAIREAGQLPGGAPVPFNWSLLYLCGTNAALVSALYWVSIGVFALFALGVAPRLTGVLTWALATSFIASPAVSYDADYLLGIVTFYLMVGYLLYGQWDRPLSLAGRLLGPADAFLFARRSAEGDAPSYAANLALRLIQVHFAVVLVVCGLHKLQMGDWWAGVAFWYPLHPPLETTYESIRPWNPYTAMAELVVLSLTQYAVLAWQVGFPFFAWRQGWWRLLLLGGAAAGWAGLTFIFGQPLFGPLLVVVGLAFLTPAEWRAAAAWFGRFRGQARPVQVRAGNARFGKPAVVRT